MSATLAILGGTPVRTRPFPAHMLFDVLDFALASGWISFALVAFFLVRNGRRLFVDRSPQCRLALVALTHMAAVAFTALLPGEAARLWMIMLPMLMAPIGIELSAWPMRGMAMLPKPLPAHG